MVLQMNLCLSGKAGCYARTAYPSVVDEASAEVQRRDPAAVTLNETCSADAAEIARRTGYQLRFAAVLAWGAPLPCVDPGGRGDFGIAVLTKDDIKASHDEAFAVHADEEERRWLCATTIREVTVCTAHLSTRGSTAQRAANDAECHELRGVLARYHDAGHHGVRRRRQPPGALCARRHVGQAGRHRHSVGRHPAHLRQPVAARARAGSGGRRRTPTTTSSTQTEAWARLLDARAVRAGAAEQPEGTPGRARRRSGCFSVRWKIHRSIAAMKPLSPPGR